MQPIFLNKRELDNRAQVLYGLSDQLLMENAANALKQVILARVQAPQEVLIVCGGGDNGGDGYALARQLKGSAYSVRVYAPKAPKSTLCQIQYQRALAAQVEMVLGLQPCSVLVDCLFGSGFKGDLSKEDQELIAQMNALEGFKLACDVPSGIDSRGCMGSIAFKAHVSVSMGALGWALFSDMAKDFVGEVLVGDLGVGRGLYEGESPLFLLEKSDLNLPLRVKQNTHKGYFGHACVFVGEQSGAGLLSALSALAFGAGLVSVLGEGFLKNSKPLEIMYAPDVPPQANAFAIGMGLGQNVPSCLEQMLQQGPCVIDADMFYCPLLKDLLELPYDLVLTPHPKEFLSLLHMVGFEVDMPELLQAKLDYALAFSQAYPHVVLLLKGANVLIAYNGHLYINTLGSSALAKAGSGDVLSGMIAALLAQGYSLLDASIHASLAHALAGSQFCSFALTPLELIKCLRELAPWPTQTLPKKIWSWWKERYFRLFWRAINTRILPRCSSPMTFFILATACFLASVVRFIMPKNPLMRLS